MPVKHELLGSLKCGIRVGMNPDMHPDRRHGSVWFDVSGFGQQRRDFTVNEPDLLAHNVEKLGMKVAQQIMLLDPSLPKQELYCKPVKIDVVGSDVRRMYELNDRRFLLEQKVVRP